MNRLTRRLVVVVRASDATRRHARVLARWARALVPAAVLVVTPPDAPRLDSSENDTITLDADRVASGPLSLADAIARALAGDQVTNQRPGGPGA
jgi:hypothetical protein